MNSATVVYGPQGCGKTRSSAELMRRLGCNNVIDIGEVVDLSAVPAGTLVLTNDPATAGALDYAEVMA